MAFKGLSALAVPKKKIPLLKAGKNDMVCSPCEPECSDDHGHIIEIGSLNSKANGVESLLLAWKINFTTHTLPKHY